MAKNEYGFDPKGGIEFTNDTASFRSVKTSEVAVQDNRSTPNRAFDDVSSRTETNISQIGSSIHNAFSYSEGNVVRAASSAVKVPKVKNDEKLQKNIELNEKLGTSFEVKNGNTSMRKQAKGYSGKGKSTLYLNDGTEIVKNGDKIKKVRKGQQRPDNYGFLVDKNKGLFKEGSNKDNYRQARKKQIYSDKNLAEMGVIDRNLSKKRSKALQQRARRDFLRSNFDFYEVDEEEIQDSGKQALKNARNGATGASDFIEDLKYDLKKHQVNKAKRAQKRSIKKEYARAFREAYKEGGVAEVARRSKEQLSLIIAKKKEEVAKKAKDSLKKIGIGGAVILIFLFLFLLLIIAISSTTTGTVSSLAYQSDIVAIESAESYLVEREQALLSDIRNFQTDYPGYDHYWILPDGYEIGHNAYDLINYLCAAFPGFTWDSGMQGVVDILFDEMYDVQISTYDTTGYTYNPDKVNDDGTIGGMDEYTITNIEMYITTKSLYEVTYGTLSETEKAYYNAYQETGGFAQHFDSPFDFNWLSNITRTFGNTYNPNTDSTDYNWGIDVAIGNGSSVYAACTGFVTAVGYDATYGNYVEITADDGYKMVVAGISQFVGVGFSVEKGTVIGSAQSSSVHVETIDANGYYRNPIFMLSCVNPETSSGDATGFGSYESGAARMTVNNGGAPEVVPYTMQTRAEFGLPEVYDDPEIENLVSYAEQFLGMPYKLGGHTRAGMDCCNFVSYVLRNSGYYDVPQSSVDGLYNRCTVVDEPQPGDLVFFVNTTGKGPDILSHVGLYIGNGVMIHCGNPCKFSNINTPYWQQYFKCYARLNR